MTVLQKLCVSFVQRTKALNLRGKTRDNELMAFMSGAAAALIAAGQRDDANHVGSVAGMVFSVRGYSECEMIATKAESPKPEDRAA